MVLVRRVDGRDATMGWAILVVALAVAPKPGPGLCATNTPKHECSRHGRCALQYEGTKVTAVCVCDLGWRGIACDRFGKTAS